MEGKLKLAHHPETVFVRSNIDLKENPRTVLFSKKRQMTKLNSALVVPASHEHKACKESSEKRLLKVNDSDYTQEGVHLKEDEISTNFLAEILLNAC